MTRPWLCCQLSAREHYAVPRALHRQGRLGLMVTDAWIPPGVGFASLASRMSPALASRYHSELAGAKIEALTSSLLSHELWWRMHRLGGWDLFLRRNEWFQQRAAQRVAAGHGPNVVFAHSYAARLPFREARSRGWTTVLGQIDPGEEHFAIVARLANEHPEYGPPPEMPPSSYFAGWREECGLADHIIVNSEWSRDALISRAIDADRIQVVPLAYEPESEGGTAPRTYPPAFTVERPLRILFVGSISVLKGVPVLLDAMRLLRGLPVRLRLVGQVAMRVPAAAAIDPTIEFAGPVARAAVAAEFHGADLLVFPSHSDGFGMVQIEAQAAGLPIVASRSSGRVVADGVSGILLPEVTAASIAASIRVVLDAPDRLRQFSSGATARAASTVHSLGDALIRIAS